MNNPFSSNLLRPWLSAGASPDENELARNAFQHVLTISSSKNVNGNFNQFKQKVEYEKIRFIVFP